MRAMDLRGDNLAKDAENMKLVQDPPAIQYRNQYFFTALETSSTAAFSDISPLPLIAITQ